MDVNMDRVPSNRTLTDQEMEMLSGIFRLILKEIRSDADKRTLAPGEPGINYETGVLYVRNPHTGNLITPNGAEELTTLIQHLDVQGNLNAEFIRDLALYTDLSQLPTTLPNMTPDTVISHMTHVPSAFVGPVETDSVAWPAKSGVFIAFKFDEETVFARFVDTINNTGYIGIYSPEQHLFDRWVEYYSVGPFKISEDTDKVVINDETLRLEDMLAITFRFVNGLEPRSKVTFNGGDPKPIVDADGHEIVYPIAENNTIMLMYDESRDAWVLNDSGESATLAGVDLVRRRVSALGYELSELADSTTTRFEQLRTYVDTGLADLETSTNQKITAVAGQVSQAQLDIQSLQETSATKEELSVVDAKFSNFDAAWVKSINGSKLPMSVMPEGVIDRLYVVSSLSVLANRADPGFPVGIGNGDTIKDVSSGTMYYVTDEAKLGTPSYADGIEYYAAGKAASVDWVNVNETPTTLDGYGITDATRASDHRSLQDQVTQLEQKVATLTTIVDKILVDPGNIDLRITNYVASGGETSVTPIENFNGSYDKLFVNYGQTVLKVGIDYNVVGNGIVLINGTTFKPDEVVQFIILKQKTS